MRTPRESTFSVRGVAPAVLLTLGCTHDPPTPPQIACDACADLAPEGVPRDGPALDRVDAEQDSSLPLDAPREAVVDSPLDSSSPDGSPLDEPTSGDVSSVPRVCDAGEQWCDDRCTPTLRDPDHCGACDRRCCAGQPCSFGVCECPAGQTACPGTCCVNLSSNSEHCGACGVRCAATQSCTGGRCVPVLRDAEVTDGMDGAVDGSAPARDVPGTSDCPSAAPLPDAARPPNRTCAVTPLPTDALRCACASPCGIVAGWEVRCNEFSWGFTAAACPDGRGYVLLSNDGYGDHKQLATLDRAGGSRVEADPFLARTEPLTPGAIPSEVVCGPDGMPHLVGEVIPGVGIAHFTRNAAGWSREAVTLTESPRPRLDDVIVDALGRVRVLHHDFSGPTWTLSTRALDGTWSRRSVPGSLGVLLAGDADGEVYELLRLPRVGGDDLAYSYAGGPPVVLYRLPPAGAVTSLIAPVERGTAGAPLVSMALSSSQLHLLVPQTGGVRDVTVLAEGAAESTDCPPMTGTLLAPPPGCTEGAVCHARGDGLYAVIHALARTQDGRTWLGYLRLHTDRDLRLTPQCGRELCTCDRTLVASRDSADAVIESVDPRTGSHAVRYRLRIADGVNLQGFTLQGRGDLLHVAAGYFPSPLDNSDVRVRYVVLDPSTLP